MPKKGERWTLLDHCKEDDDILSYLFIDLGFFRKQHDKHRRISRKFNTDEFKAKQSVNWDAYLEILSMVKKGELTPREGSLKLLRKGTIKTLLQKKRQNPEHAHLVSHVDRYMELWRPDSPFKIFETSRYKTPGTGKGKGKALSVSATEPGLSPPVPAEGLTEIATASAADPQSAPSSPQKSTGTSTPTKKESPFGPPLDLGVKSLRAYQVHEHLRLFGSAADITSEEDEELRMDQAQLKADFSVLYSHSKQCVQLFLGPGRFVNHDCNPNVELIRSGNRLCFKVVRPIEPNDEILTFYGSEYFGPGNENCLCLTCKKNRKGAYKKPEKVGKKAKVAIPEDPAARRTRSGQQPAKVVSLRKQVHKANLARTTVSLTQGSRRSERTQTQVASTSSILNARKMTGRGSAGGHKRKRGDSSSSEGEAQDDVDYRSKTKVRAKRAKKGRKKSSAGSDSSLTDVEELVSDFTFEQDSIILSTEQTAGDDTTTNPSILPEAEVKGMETAAEEVAPLQPLPFNLIAASIPVIDGDIPSPLSGSTPRDFAALSPAPSDSVGESSAPGTPSGFGLKLGEHLSSIAKGAGSILCRALPLASINSDTASQSQSSVFELEEESKE